MKILIITIGLLSFSFLASGLRVKTRLRKFEPGNWNSEHFHKIPQTAGNNGKIISVGDDYTLQYPNYTPVSKAMSDVVFTKAVPSEEDIPKHEAFLNVPIISLRNNLKM